jgi:outer membrane protein OmpA-like peptidoglycan-associated protein
LKIIFYFIALFSLAFISSLSQENQVDTDTLKHYGIFGHYQLNMHQPNFDTLTGIPTCCPLFDAGKGTGFTLGGFVEFPLPYKLTIGLRIGFSNLNGQLTKTESVPIRIDDKLDSGKFQHILNAYISDLGFEPYLSFKIYKELKIHAGGHIGFIMKKKYDYVEKLIEPIDRGVFVDSDTRTRNQLSGDIPKASGVYAGILVGIGYELPLNNTGSFRVSPELFYTIGMNDLVQGKSWKLDLVRFGLSMKYTPIPEKPEPVEKKQFFQHIDTVKIESAEIAKKFIKQGNPIISNLRTQIGDTIYISETMQRTDTLFYRPKPTAKFTTNTDTITIKTQFVTEAFPLLPMIFFDDGSSELSKDYDLIDNIGNFKIENLPTNPKAFHKNILNIIAERLINEPNSEITLKGTVDSTTEKGDCALAIARAERVKKYFTEICGIDPNRIKISKIKGRCSPKNATITPNDSGYAENRRVEISSDNQDILMPILRKKFLEATDYYPDKLDIITDGTTMKGLSSWTVIVNQDNRTIFRKEGKDSFDEVISVSLVNTVVDSDNFPGFTKYEADIGVTQDTNTHKIISSNIPVKIKKQGTSFKIPRELALSLSNTPVQIDLYIEDTDSQTDNVRKFIFIKKDTSEIEIQRMSLVLFDVGSNKISEAARKGIINFIKDLDENSSIRITGYTDVLGEQENNIKLSQERAENTANIIRKKQPKAEITVVEGVAATRFPPGIYSYSTPAERFLTRTVLIEILRRK